jgi:hypothetical protein
VDVLRKIEWAMTQIGNAHRAYSTVLWVAMFSCATVYVMGANAILYMYNETWSSNVLLFGFATVYILAARTLHYGKLFIFFASFLPSARTTTTAEKWERRMSFIARRQI